MATYHWLTAMGTLPMAKPRCWESLKAESDLKKQTTSNSESNDRLEKANKLKDELENNLGNEEIKLKEFEVLYDDAEREKNELEQNFSNAEKRNELDNKIKEKT